MNVYQEVEEFYRNYPGEKRIFGYSEEGRALFALFVGRHEFPVGISQAAIHGREWITALLSLELIKRGLEIGGSWVIPLSNPDGALLSEVGIGTVKKKEPLIKINGGTDFSLWKANARGVDLNVNFDARWGKGEQNVFSPAPQNYVGSFPLCARESAALVRFTQDVAPDFTLSLHTKGEEIYWSFHQPPKRLKRDRALAEALSRAVGCPLREAKGSVGGYKDWCIQELKIPAFTVEVGENKISHPIGRTHLKELVQKYGDALGVLTRSYHGREVHARGVETRRES